MRWLGIVRLDTFQFNRFHRGRLALDFLFQSLKQFVLFGHHVIQLLDLMFKMRDVRFDTFESLQSFIVHTDEDSQFFQIR
jgi:hypothetical protein